MRCHHQDVITVWAGPYGLGRSSWTTTTDCCGKVTLQGTGHRLSYRVVAIQTVAKDALASDSQAFDQTGDHRLVLITCTGVYHPDQGGYDRNLVVIARPLGSAR